MKNKIIFPKITSAGKRHWGEEKFLLLYQKKISLKLLKIKKGSKGGLQFHRRKK